MDSWQWRPGTALLLLLVALLYGHGWWRRRREPLLAWGLWRLLVFLTGLTLLCVTLMSPLNRWAGQVAYWRSAQHLLLLAVIPPLLVIPDPLPSLLQGLPASLEERVEALIRPGAPFYRLLQAVTPAGVVYFLFMATFWIWYDSRLHLAALRSPGLRTLEQASLLTAAVLYWWHIARATPRIHPALPDIPHILFTLAGAFPIKIVGIVLLFAPDNIYDYGSVTGSDQAQASGGALIWMLGGVTYSATAAVFLRRWMSQEEDKPPLSHSEWLTEERMLAPGMEGRRNGRADET